MRGRTLEDLDLDLDIVGTWVVVVCRRGKRREFVRGWSDRRWVESGAMWAWLETSQGLCVVMRGCAGAGLVCWVLLPR